MILSKIIEVIYYLLLLFLAIRSIISIRYNGFIAKNFLNVYIIITAGLELYSYVLLISKQSPKGILYNFYCLLSILLFYFFYRIYFKRIYLKLFNLIFFSVLFFYLCCTNFYKSDFDVSIGILISLYYIGVSLLWFYYKINSFDEYEITSDPYFWISTGLLMWSCFFLFRVIPMFYFAKVDNEFLEFLHLGQNIINICMYSMFYLALIKYERKLHR
ncbi:hypothetical protein ASG22_13985 [Chryseobacterium sp. Leaf405]|nr:hypothetical protein ASG22_13985 [Chryseobacterium sp. Leaf405]